ncbi:methionine--tRNA ligase [Nanobdella aerobiophila]|uniref:methionine--tRNA ligase n=1 Tax=Nanobdella aerobiophila TaxID=2586965 RepID=A0A915SKI4_9ARCH|nr:class I tRNA ligase family protein [Nanobdella aerobiophila]BBL45361.1 methionine--tRNA ligase [Nanobdella aerobiophila]
MDKDIIIVTSALPYVNNVPHIGNIIGSLLPSDIFARYNRMKGNIVFYLCGTDDHGSTTEVEAIKYNMKPSEVVRYFHNIHEKIYKWFNFSFDIFSGTSNNNIHYRITQEFFIKSFINGYITEKEVELPYDPQWSKFLSDRFVVGTCPYCNYENAKGDQCEACGRLLDPKELINPKNAITKNPVIFKKTRHLYLNLTKLEDNIKKYLETKKSIFTDLAISMSLGWVKEGLKERSITRDLSFGVPVPYNDLWLALRKKIFNELDFTSKEKFLDSFINSLKGNNLLVPEEEYIKIKTIVEENWPQIDNILNKYNYFESYNNKVLYVWYDALIGYISFTAQSLRKEYRKEDLINIDLSGIKVLEEGENFIKLNIDGTDYRVEYTIDNKNVWIKIDNNFKNLEKIAGFLLSKGFENVKFNIDWSYLWKNGKIYHFLGKDNIPFHAVFWPGILLSTYNVPEDYKEFFNYTDLENYNLPYNVIGLSYLLYEGKKISKSQNWGIFCDSLIDSDLEPDYWRFYLSYIIPYSKDSDFKWSEFKEIINKELVNNIGNMEYRVLSFINRYYNGRIAGRLNDNIKSKIKEVFDNYNNYMEKGEFHMALRNILELGNYGNKIFQDNKPWESPEKYRDLLYSLLILIIYTYLMLYPFTPTFYDKFIDNINIKIYNFDELNKLLNNNIEFTVNNNIRPLFMKVDDSIIDKISSIVTRPKNHLIR